MRTISPWLPSAERDRASIVPLASSTGALSDAELAEAELDQVVAAGGSKGGRLGGGGGSGGGARPPGLSA